MERSEIRERLFQSFDQTDRPFPHSASLHAGYKQSVRYLTARRTASSISFGGSTLTTIGLPVSKKLLRLDRMSGQPMRPPDRISSGTSHWWDSLIVNRTASPSASIS